MTAPHDAVLPSRRARRRHLPLIAGAAAALVAGAAITMAASPAPSSDPSSGSEPGIQSEGTPWGGPGRHGGFGRGPGGLFDGFAGFAGRHGGFATGDITITANDGSSVSLATVDGWQRTISITDATTLTREGETIGRSDLRVGDRIRLRQAVDDAGAYTVTAVDVVLPKVVGRVTAVGSDSLTLQQPNGTSVTVRVDASTTVLVGGTESALSAITVGMRVAAGGEQATDGSFDAEWVRAGIGRGFGPGRFGTDGAPGATPTASPETDGSSTSAG